MILEKLLYPSHPVRCIITGPGEGGKSVFLTKMTFNTIHEFEKKTNIYSSSLHQDLYRTIIKCFSNFKPVTLGREISKEEDLDSLSEEMVKYKDLRKLEKETETYESTEELKYPLEHDPDFPILTNLDYSNEKESKNPSFQAMFKRSRHKNISLFHHFPRTERTTKENNSS